MVNTIGLVLNVFGSAMFLIDNYRLSGLMSSMVHQMSEDHGRFDSKKFPKEEMKTLSTRIKASGRWNIFGGILFLSGFFLQLLAAINSDCSLSKEIMTWIYQYYSISGQLLDIFGVLILFYSGLPFKMPKVESYAVIEVKPEQLKKDKKQKRIAYLGLSLLLLGFILQLIGTIKSI